MMAEGADATTAMARLDVLTGTWRSRGRILPGGSDSGVEISGTDRYEWLGDGFLVHWVDVHMGSEKIEVIEVIGGYDASTQTYPMRSFDNHGNFVTMHAGVSDDGVWTFADETTRATLKIGSDGRTMSATWERCDDGSTWTHWMDMTFTKIE